jgi:hypothetical protein
MTSHNSRLVALQQQTQQMNAAVTAALAVVRKQVEQRMEKDEIIAGLRWELEEGGGQLDVAHSGLEVELEKEFSQGEELKVEEEDSVGEDDSDKNVDLVCGDNAEE